MRTRFKLLLVGALAIIGIIVSTGSPMLLADAGNGYDNQTNARISSI